MPPSARRWPPSARTTPEPSSATPAMFVPTSLRFALASGTRGGSMQDRWLERLDDRRQELVALTRDLVRIPTVNPPGDAYAPCAELIGQRLRARGFEVTYQRGLDSPGDSDRFPRVNVIARFESGRPGPCVPLNGHID